MDLSPESIAKLSGKAPSAPAANQDLDSKSLSEVQGSLSVDQKILEAARIGMAAEIVETTEPPPPDFVYRSKVNIEKSMDLLERVLRKI
jgi:hypothetical protein